MMVSRRRGSVCSRSYITSVFATGVLVGLWERRAAPGGLLDQARTKSPGDVAIMGAMARAF